MYCTIPLKNRNCIIQSIKSTVQQEKGGVGGFRYCTSSLYHLNLSPFYSTPLQAVYKYKVMYSVIKCVFSASVELALLRGLKQSSYFSKGSFNPSGVLVTQFAWLAPAGCTGSDRTKFHWHDKISYQVLYRGCFSAFQDISKPLHDFKGPFSQNLGAPFRCVHFRAFIANWHYLTD